MLGNLDSLRKRLPDDRKLRRLLDNAMEAAQRGASLTQRMLAFARRQELKTEPVDVPELVRNMADLLQRSIGPAVQIETHFPLALAPAFVDANQLELAILNLVVNARDAMPEGGTITIAAQEAKDRRRIRSSRLEARSLCLPVCDRHRRGHGRRDAGAGRRAVLHDQGHRQGHGARAVHGPWLCRAIGGTVGAPRAVGRGHDG